MTRGGTPWLLSDTTVHGMAARAEISGLKGRLYKCLMRSWFLFNQHSPRFCFFLVLREGAGQTILSSRTGVLDFKRL